MQIKEASLCLHLICFLPCRLQSGVLFLKLSSHLLVALLLILSSAALDLFCLVRWKGANYVEWRSEWEWISHAAKLQCPEVSVLVKNPSGLAYFGKSHLAAHLCSGWGEGKEIRSLVLTSLPVEWEENINAALSPSWQTAAVDTGWHQFSTQNVSWLCIHCLVPPPYWPSVDGEATINVPLLFLLH